MSLSIKLIFLIVTLGLLQSCNSVKKEQLNTRTLAQLKIPPPDIQPAVSFNIAQDEVIKNYQALVSIVPKGENFGKETKRLADLELHQSIDLKLADDEQLNQQGDKKSASAILRYQQYLKNYPSRSDNDVVMYQLARAYAFEGEPNKSRQVMDQLVEQFPGSKYSQEVQFRRGENLFVAKNYPYAARAYNAVIQHGYDSVFYEKALYKHGWSKFKLNKTIQALDSFIQLLEIKYEQGAILENAVASSNSNAENELLDDVFRVTSLSFSYRPEKQAIKQYFNQRPHQKFEPLLYQKLAQLYLSKERELDAADTYLAYAAQNPNSEFSPLIHNLAIDVYKNAAFPTLLLKQKQQFIRSYNKGSLFWSRQSNVSQKQVASSLTLHMIDLASHFHAVAQSSKKTQDYQRAIESYRLFLKSFPRHDRAPEMNFLLAEVLLANKNYPFAIVEFEKTAYQYPRHNRSAEAAYAALLVHEQQIQKANRTNKAGLNLSRIASAEKFSVQFLNDRRMPTVLLNTASRYFELKQYQAASLAANRLIKNNNADTEIKHQAWTLIANSEYELQHYAKAEIGFSQVLKAYIPRVGKNKKQHDNALDLMVSSIYKQGDIARANNQHLIAAVHFQRVAKHAPKSKIRITSDYDAATEYIAIKDWRSAINLLEVFRNNFPKHNKWRLGTSQKLALAYQQSGQPQKAASEMLKIAELGPKKDKAEWVWQAAVLYEEAEQNDRLIEIYKRYLTLNKAYNLRTIEVRNNLANIYKTKNETKKYHYWLDNMINVDAKNKSKRLPRSQFLAAHARLILTQSLHQKFNEVKLTVPLKKSLKRKKKYMKQALKAYSQAAKYQVEEVTTASTYNIAEIYGAFAKSLLNSDRPKGLNEEELEEYNYLLEDQAYPFEEKAIKIHQRNITRIPKGIYNESVKQSLKSLSKILPFRYAKQEVLEVFVDANP